MYFFGQKTCILSSNREKWPVAVRANGHLLLNSEKVRFCVTWLLCCQNWHLVARQETSWDVSRGKSDISSLAPSTFH